MEYGMTSHAPRSANTMAVTDDTAHNDANTIQRERRPNESLRRLKTQYSGSTVTVGDSVPGIYALAFVGGQRPKLGGREGFDAATIRRQPVTTGLRLSRPAYTTTCL
jgi:hypothetical protein